MSGKRLLSQSARRIIPHVMAPPPRLEGLLTIDDFEEAARGVLSKLAYDYYRSGADGEATLRANRDAFGRYELFYRVLVDVSRLHLATQVLGTDVSSPILIAPTAYHRLAHPDGELATARAAARQGTLLVVSTLATTTLEDVARASTGPKWFQLYVHKDRGMTHALVERAEAAGYLALVVTVDTPVLGRRLADERNEFGLPEGLTMANLTLPGTSGAEGDPVASSMLARYVATRHDTSLTWHGLEVLAASTRLPVVLKGIVRPDDAERAVLHGARGVVVSNHGARQLDGAPATIDALSAIADRIADRCEVYLDGGIRWGTDVLKALGLGARAVLVGRPILWGLATFGEAGVARVLEMLRDELGRAMALAGSPDVRAIDRDLVRKRP
jgi:4-hydroxymandelate oxidase